MLTTNPTEPFPNQQTYSVYSQPGIPLHFQPGMQYIHPHSNQSTNPASIFPNPGNPLIPVASHTVYFQPGIQYTHPPTNQSPNPMPTNPVNPLNPAAFQLLMTNLNCNSAYLQEMQDSQSQSMPVNPLNPGSVQPVIANIQTTPMQLNPCGATMQKKCHFSRITTINNI